MRPIDADALKERAIKMSTAKGHVFMKAVGTHEINKAPTLTLDNLGIVRCSDCVWFDDEGYENHDPEMPELRMGFCKIWRRDTQACRFCSMGGGE